MYKSSIDKSKIDNLAILADEMEKEINKLKQQESDYKISRQKNTIGNLARLADEMEKEINKLKQQESDYKITHLGRFFQLKKFSKQDKEYILATYS